MYAADTYMALVGCKEAWGSNLFTQCTFRLGYYEDYEELNLLSPWQTTIGLLFGEDSYGPLHSEIKMFDGPVQI